MLKRVIFSILVALGGWLVFRFVPQPALALTAVSLPPELAALISGGIYFLVEMLLAGRVPDEALQRISAAITAGILEIIAVALGLIPAQFGDLATGLLNVLVILLGLVSGAKLLFAGGQRLRLLPR